MRAVEMKRFREAPEESFPTTSFAFSSEDSAWICGDPNGSIHIFGAALTPESHGILDDGCITSIAIPRSGEMLLVSDRSNQVHFYEYPNLTISRRSIFRSQLPVTAMAFCKNSSHCFIASMSPDIAVCNPGEDATIKKLSTFDQGSRCLALSLDDNFVSIVDFEGDVIVYNLKFQESITLGHVLAENTVDRSFRKVVPKSVARNFTQHGLKLSWLPHKSIHAFAVPAEKGSFLLVSRIDAEKWTEGHVVNVSDASGFSHEATDVNLTVFSPNGRYIASADLNGVVLIWSVHIEVKDGKEQIVAEEFAPVAKLECGEALYDLCWGPNEGDNYLMIASVDKYERVDNVIDLASGAVPPTGEIEAVMPSASATTSPPANTVRARIDSNVNDSSATVSNQSSGVTPSVSRVILSDKPTETSVTDLPVSTASTAIAGADSVAATSTTAATAEADANQQSQFRRLQKKSGDADRATTEDDDDAILEKEDNAPWALAGSSAEDVSIEAMKRPLHNNRSVLDEPTVEDDDFIEDDMAEGANSQDALVRALQQAASGVGGEYSGNNLAAVLASAINGQSVKLQPPFQPSATKFDEKNRRYLVWNYVGNIFLRDEETSNRIEVRFANTSGRNKNDAFTDNYGFVMASLAYEGAIYATEAEAPQVVPENDPDFVDTSRGSTIMYRAFAGQTQLNGANETFVYTLESREAAQAVAVGMGWCAVATSKGFLRIFSSTGVQLQIIRLKGPVVTLIGAGSQLAVFYHSSAPVNDIQQIAVEIFEINRRNNTRRSVLNMPVPMTAKSVIDWAGFDMDSGNLVVMDSDGVLSMLIGCMGWQWMPVLDIKTIRKSTEHRYWPIAVKTNKLACILLNGESRPAVYPQPTPTLKTFHLPIVAVSEGKDKELQNNRAQQLIWDDANAAHYDALRESYSSTGSLPDGITATALFEVLAQRQNEADKAVLVLLQDACKFNKIATCLDLAHSLRTEKGLQAAITICNHFGRSPVATKIEELLQQRVELNAAAQAEANAAMGNNENYNTPRDYEEEADDYHESNAIAAPGALSRRASNHEFSSSMQGANKTKNSRTETSSEEDYENAPAPKKAAVSNPFAKQSPMASPGKRKNAFDSFKELKGSPSPKKPMLSRQSSFAQAARSKMTTKMNLL